MADGVAHARASVRVAYVVTIVAGSVAVVLHPVAAGAVMGAWLAVLATPDLDHHVRTFDEDRMRRFNVIVGWVWWLYWWPYERLVPHRGSSHTWPKGTVVRLAYLLWALIAITALLFAVEYPMEWIAWWLTTFGGWTVVDMRHLWMDGLTPLGGRRRWFKG
jgi:uncharacterized metal-binding protein